MFVCETQKCHTGLKSYASTELVVSLETMLQAMVLVLDFGIMVTGRKKCSRAAREQNLYRTQCQEPPPAVPGFGFFAFRIHFPGDRVQCLYAKLKCAIRA